MKESRQQGKVTYPVDEIPLYLIAVPAGAETFVGIARFGSDKLMLMRCFCPFKDGTPAQDLGNVLAVLDTG